MVAVLFFIALFLFGATSTAETGDLTYEPGNDVGMETACLLSLRMTKTKSKLKVPEATVEQAEGYNDVFQKVHDDLVSLLSLAQVNLDKTKNDIDQKQTDLNNKIQELSNHQGSGSAWDWLKRSWMNLFYATESRLTAERDALQQELNVMKNEAATLEENLDNLNRQILENKEEHSEHLAGLNTLVTKEKETIAQETTEKEGAEKLHAKLMADMEKEHLAKIEVMDTVTERLNSLVHEKRDELYSLTATCTQHTKNAVAICKKCSNGKACGDTCISKEKKCHKAPGCACDDSIGHKLHVDFARVKKTLEGTISLQVQELKQNEQDIKDVEADKAAADRVYEDTQKELADLKAKLENTKRHAEEELAEKTQASEQAASDRETELKRELEELQEQHAAQRQLKDAELAAHESMRAEKLESHGAKIGDFDSKIEAAKARKTRYDNAAQDLKHALDEASAAH